MRENVFLCDHLLILGTLLGNLTEVITVILTNRHRDEEVRLLHILVVTVVTVMENISRASVIYSCSL